MTAISYPDISKTSAAGSFRVEARSPDNGTIPPVAPADTQSFGARYGQEQRNFRYQLIQVGPDAVLWERWQATNEPSPRDLFISDTGWVVIHCSDQVADSLYAISPTGEQTCVLQISPSFDHDNLPASVPGHAYYSSDRIVQSSLGISWTVGAIDYFLDLDDSPHFIILTAWGDRILLDLTAGTLISPTVRQENICQILERQLATTYLADLNRALTATEPLAQPETQAFWQQWPHLRGYLTIAVRTRAVETLPYLHQIIQYRIVGSYSTCHGLPDEHNIQTHELRSLLKLAIRRLGDFPAEYSCYSFFRTDFADDDDDDGTDIYYPVSDPVENRDRLLKTVSEEDTSVTILQRLGAPDLCQAYAIKGDERYYWGEHWDYYYNLGDDISFLRLSWQPGTSGQHLAAMVYTSPMTPGQIETRLG